MVTMLVFFPFELFVFPSARVPCLFFFFSRCNFRQSDFSEFLTMQQVLHLRCSSVYYAQVAIVLSIMGSRLVLPSHGRFPFVYSPACPKASTRRRLQPPCCSFRLGSLPLKSQMLFLYFSWYCRFFQGLFRSHQFWQDNLDTVFKFIFHVRTQIRIVWLGYVWLGHWKFVEIVLIHGIRGYFSRLVETIMKLFSPLCNFLQEPKRDLSS